MYTHSKRWEKAQEIEKIYWRKDFFRDSEFKELISKYDEVFDYIEEKYNFTENTKILDLGCGATCPSVLFRKGKKYGVEPLVEAFLEKDKKKLADRIQLHQGTGENIPFEDSFFDVVLCRNALDHMDNIPKVMDEIGRVIDKGGVIILSIYVYVPFIVSLKRASEYVPFLRNIEHPFTYTETGFKRLCGTHFEVLEEKIIFEGKSSVDYGKQDVDMKEPILHKIFAWANRYLLMNDWFLREYLIVCRKR